MKKGKGKLTPKQARFVDEYLIDLNATQASIRAGYSAKTAEQQGPRLLGNVGVSAAIAKGMETRSKRTQITQDRVLQELARIAFFDIRRLYNDNGTLKLPTELDDEAAAVLSTVEVTENKIGEEIDTTTKKAKVFDKGNALTLAMRHLGMLNDKMTHTGPGDGPIPIAVGTAKEFQRVAEEVASKV